jgi:hypothetical protein
LRHDPRQQQPRLLAARQRPDRRARLRLVEQEILQIAHHMRACRAPSPGRPCPRRRISLSPVRLSQSEHRVERWRGSGRTPPSPARCPASPCPVSGAISPVSIFKASSCPRRWARQRPPGRRAGTASRNRAGWTLSPKALEMPAPRSPACRISARLQRHRRRALTADLARALGAHVACSARTRPWLRLRRALMPSTAQRASALILRSSLWRAGPLLPRSCRARPRNRRSPLLPPHQRPGRSRASRGSARAGTRGRG